MPGVAINGSQIKETIVPGYITYEIWKRQIMDGVWKWVLSEEAETGVRITGSVVVPSSKMKIMGENVATVDNITNETWVASPPVPENSRTVDIRNINPGKSGSGHGKINNRKLQRKTGWESNCSYWISGRNLSRRNNNHKRRERESEIRKLGR
ncbi:hypothetical protein HMSSN036_03400 [Paenibacillus macerans]|nr:hypothetical protein HMSSN036_03400 [Paenibacillus macerans]